MGFRINKGHLGKDVEGYWFWLPGCWRTSSLDEEMHLGSKKRLNGERNCRFVIQCAGWHWRILQECWPLPQDVFWGANGSNLKFCCATGCFSQGWGGVWSLKIACWEKLTWSHQFVGGILPNWTNFTWFAWWTSRCLSLCQLTASGTCLYKNRIESPTLSPYMCRNVHKDWFISVISKIGDLPVRLLGSSQGHQF